MITPLLLHRTSLICSLLSPLLLYATNGDQMAATGTKSMGMGGVSIAMAFGAESGLSNPALLTALPQRQFSLTATSFFPSIQTAARKEPSSGYTPLYKSNADFYLIPSLAYATPLGEGIYAGIGVWGVGGMGVDFSSTPAGSGLMQMQTDLMLMHLALPLGYRIDPAWSIGIAPILQAGMLNISLSPASVEMQLYDKCWDTSLGAVIGATYRWTDTLTVGATYRTAITMRYKGEYGRSLTLEQPEEYGVGISWQTGRHTVAADIKRIAWGSAEGYEQFGWRDQNVYAVGYQYETVLWSLRTGFNYGRTPVDTSRTVSWQNYLNLLGFPATCQSHYTVGGSYHFDTRYTLDAAAVYSPVEKRSGTILDGALRSIKIYNEHEEFSLSLQLNYRF